MIIHHFTEEENTPIGKVELEVRDLLQVARTGFPIKCEELLGMELCTRFVLRYSKRIISTRKIAVLGLQADWYATFAALAGVSTENTGLVLIFSLVLTISHTSEY